jgi:hypothetical protein
MKWANSATYETGSIFGLGFGNPRRNLFLEACSSFFARKNLFLFYFIEIKINNYNNLNY